MREQIESMLQEKRELSDTYVDQLEDNLIYSEYADDVRKLLQQGSGGELAGERPKFHSVGSSAALAVNSFCFWMNRPAELRIAGETGFSGLQFEKQLSSGLGGTPPNLDVYLERSPGPVCMEAKFLEPLGNSKASFSESYEGIQDDRISSKWYKLYRRLKSSPNSFRYLDVAQLVKHYFGITNPKHRLQGPVLVYLYWEPINGDAVEVFREHRSELQRLQDMVGGDELLGFSSMSYSELWNEWEGESADAAKHVANLRDWYELAVDLD